MNETKWIPAQPGQTSWCMNLGGANPFAGAACNYQAKRVACLKRNTQNAPLSRVSLWHTNATNRYTGAPVTDNRRYRLVLALWLVSRYRVGRCRLHLSIGLSRLVRGGHPGAHVPTWFPHLSPHSFLVWQVCFVSDFFCVPSISLTLSVWVFVN